MARREMCLAIAWWIPQWRGRIRKGALDEGALFFFQRDQRVTCGLYPAFQLGMSNRNEKPTGPRRWLRRIVITGASLFAALSVGAIFQARGMCRYERPTARTTHLSQVGGWEKARLLLCGPVVRRQNNTRTPRDFGLSFETERFSGAHGISLEAWHVPGDSSKPLIAMLPGYGASKDTLLRAAAEFHAFGNEVYLLDFHGAGGSAGTTTTVGFDEADDIDAVVKHLNGRKYLLYGTSMGAVATLRAVHLGKAQPEQLILEAPFDTFLNTIGHRFDLLNLPRLPFAHLLVFWSGAINGFNGFAHNPLEYSRSVRCPTLLMQGAQDELVGSEVPAKFAEAMGENVKVAIIPNARHAFLFQSEPEIWRKLVREFLLSNESGNQRAY